MNVRVTRRAQVQIERAADWWYRNRELAPDAFDEDLTKAFSLLATEPLIGVPVTRHLTHIVRRLHLARIRYHLYYRIRGADVEVLAFWHTSRGTRPFADSKP